MELNGRRIVITGAASGIGRALLNRLAAHPAAILAVDINEAGLGPATGQGAAITPLGCDLSRQEEVDRLFETAAAVLGGVDLFIANAGFAYYEQVNQADWEHMAAIFRLNVFSALYSLEKMQLLNGEKPYKVVITASAMAHIGVPGYALYSATKAALHRFAEVYRWQPGDGRRLMLVYPISTRTGFFEAAGENTPIPWPSQSPEQVAEAILRGIERDQKEVYPSRLFQWVHFLSRFLPMPALVQALEQRRWRNWLRRQPPGAAR